MRKFTFLLVFMAMSYYGAFAQTNFSILFVDDTDDTFGNAPYFASALDSTGYSYTYFNAVDSAASPTDTYMSNFDLVIWHTSSDGNGLYLWNGDQTDNIRLKTYLDNGGMLWVVGNDFLFNRYGTPPVVWQGGDFMYDYFGVDRYSVQAYGDDSGVGLPQADPDTANAIPGLPTLTWQFATLWWPDGVSLRSDAVPIYRMGGTAYTFADTVTGSWYDNGTSKVLAFYFDLSLANNFGLIRSTTGSVVSFFEQLADTTASLQDFPAQGFSVYPNPNKGAFSFEFDLKKPLQVSATLLDLQGRQVQSLFYQQPLFSGHHEFNWQIDRSIPTGIYLLRVEGPGTYMTKPVFYLD